MSGIADMSFGLLPGFAKSLAASAWGGYLMQLRYGGGLENRIREAKSRETFSVSQWREWREEKLRHMLRHAAETVPYYRSFWKTAGKSGKYAEKLADWPLLEKETVRSNPKAFVSEKAQDLIKEATSGSTGTPLTVYSDREAQRRWYALFEARWRRWYGVSLRDRWGILGGRVIVPFNRRKPPFWIWNAGMNQLYMSCHHLSPEFLPYYADAVMKHRLTYLLGYSSALYTLAVHLLETGRSLPSLRVVVTNAEPLLDYQRETISRAFRCPVRETYGMSEMVAGAGECEKGVLHLWADAGVVETAEGGAVLPPGSPGDLICTGLLNEAMPLIRYRVGDRGAIDLHAQCACGRTLPVVKEIEGRSDDVLITRDGREIGRLDHVFKSDLPVREAQIIQESFSCIRIRYVPAGNVKEEAERKMTDAVKERLGDMRVVFEQVPVIERAAGGKFRAVLNRIPAEELKRNRKGGRVHS